MDGRAGPPSGPGRQPRRSVRTDDEFRHNGSGRAPGRDIVAAIRSGASQGADFGRVPTGRVMTIRTMPITTADLPAVAQFLHRHLNTRVPADAWADAVAVPWKVA